MDKMRFLTQFGGFRLKNTSSMSVDLVDGGVLESVGKDFYF